ncbi:MAG: glycosyltransferase family 2 protein [Desulfamplus sp.]|nr:glycosyltransferase family 2 protein [Desulfamplus sp.]MBF0411542.1 glycosyltransferase family 2 protein [Desulfamplus sp.]
MKTYPNLTRKTDIIPKLTIVFLNFNRLDDTVKTAAQLKKLCYDRNNIEIIAVDNGSKDGTSQFLESQSDWIISLKLKDNLGIEGLNLGFEMATGEYILVLDDDSHPLNINTIDLLIQSLDRNKDAGAIACKIESEDGTPFQTWHIPDTKTDLFCESAAFVGCGFAIRRDIFQEIGWFPAKYFLYQNEIDVAIKIRQLGYKIYYNPECTVVHRNSPTGRAGWRQVFYPTRNTIWLLRQYAPFPMSAYYIFSRLCFGFIRAFESGEYRWYLKAVKEAFQCRIKKSPLTPSLHKSFLILWHQNSIVHHIKWAAKVKCTSQR